MKSYQFTDEYVLGHEVKCLTCIKMQKCTLQNRKQLIIGPALKVSVIRYPENTCFGIFMWIPLTTW